VAECLVHALVHELVEHHHEGGGRGKCTQWHGEDRCRSSDLHCMRDVKINSEK
jgi:hypothetical protein